MITTTKKHFDIYKQECLRLIDLFHLSGWRVYFEHSEMREKYGQMESDIESYIANMGLNKKWDDTLRPCNEAEIRKLALHEVIHLLLAPISDLGKSRFVIRDELYAAEEELVHKLERIIGS
jgi:hypothetical protein